ncbi:hypothetical protein [Ensifer sp. 22460]|uniref:hypothetical protein n=1 Tax=Ensifer sp. 22460 TaxID=3453922 RepID=UPI003F87701E
MDLESPTSRTQLAVFTTGQSFLLVVLPPMGRRLGFSDIHIAGILSLAALLMMVSAPAWVIMEDLDNPACKPDIDLAADQAVNRH